MFQFFFRFSLYISVNDRLYHGSGYKVFILHILCRHCGFIQHVRSDRSKIKPSLNFNLILAIYGMWVCSLPRFTQEGKEYIAFCKSIADITNVHVCGLLI